MNIYMGYGPDGPEEGAVLIFAITRREAKSIFWRDCQGMMFEEYIDMRLNRIRNKSWLFAEANPALLLGSTPHCIDSPKTCKACERWGAESPIGEDGYCGECRTERREYETDQPR